METPQNGFKRFLILLFISLILYSSAVILTYSVVRHNSLPNVRERLSAGITAVYADIDKEIRRMEGHNLNDRDAFTEFLSVEFERTFSEKGLEFIIYEHDSLQYWTDNIFTAPIVKKDWDLKPGIIRNGSGYYLVEQRWYKDHLIVALQLLQYNYNYSNEYLPLGFHNRFDVPVNVSINFERGDYNIFGPSGKFLFSISSATPFELAIWLQYVIFSLYVISFLFIVSAMSAIFLTFLHQRRKGLGYLLFLAIVLLFRLVQIYLRFPSGLYETQLFNPSYFASSDFLPSLGDFLINTLIGVQLAFIAFKQASYRWKSLALTDFQRTIAAILVLCTLTTGYYFLTQTIVGLVLNSSISFSFGNILSLPYISHVGVLIVASLLLGFLFVVELSGKYLSIFISNKVIYCLFSSVVVLLYTGFSFFTGTLDILHILFLLSLFTILFFRIRVKHQDKFKFSRVILTLFVLAALATYLFNQAENIREHEKRQLLAVHLSDARDNFAEYYFSEAYRSIRVDRKLAEILNDTSDLALTQATRYLEQTYFSGYWKKYLIQITVCQMHKKLSIKPGNIITGCEDYFDGKIAQFMRPIAIPGLFFLRRSVDAMYYLGKISLDSSTLVNRSGVDIFVEISSNNIWKSLGYPELLIDTKNVKTDNLYGYSYAFYFKGELVKNVGIYAYDISNRMSSVKKSEFSFLVNNDFSHLLFKPDTDTLIIVSKEEPRISDLISPFSYLLFLMAIMLLLINGFSGSTLIGKIDRYTFRLRLQIIMLSVIVVSSIVLVTVSLMFIQKLNSNKNNEILSEKCNSILVDLENRYGGLSCLDSIPAEELSDLLLSFSNTYFTDINIYTPKGFLLSTSRDQIFTEGMISRLISPESARQLMMGKKSFFIERESIGTYSFLSAYTPIRNNENRLLGYLNLPYFAKQEEIKREISGLITAFANIYLFLISITVLLAILLSRYITKPLQLIGNQFSIIRIGNKNAKIVWKRKDEIGRLVEEYNRMIDEMEKSAELLARSERESAWRLMARQVAHEIKNPLTPIKLSMQLLMRAWDDKAPDWELRLKRFSQTLIMQIDTLSSIATEFSDFAQMPEPQLQQFDIIPIIQQSAALFRNQSDCDIAVITDRNECIIQADPNQMLRVFNNLIKNALQSIPDDRKGVVTIRLGIENQTCEISLKDNGSGIPTEMQTRIFSPNFTTKTAGMGLGLAMVKNIVENSSGHIWFETDPGKGTTFYVSLPLKPSEHEL